MPPDGFTREQAVLAAQSATASLDERDIINRVAAGGAASLAASTLVRAVTLTPLPSAAPLRNRLARRRQIALNRSRGAR